MLKNRLQTQTGIALAIVVWFIAGMSLLVAGIVSHASLDTRMAQLHVAKAKVRAAGDGAIHLFLADVLAGKLSPAMLSGEGVEYQLGELSVRVTAVPGAGLIDLNSAGPALLSSLFTVAGDMDKDDAQLLANNVVDWRSKRTRRSSGKYEGGRFTGIEDMLRVDGVSRTLLDGIREYVVAGRAASGTTNWQLSPPHVLALLESVDAGQYAVASRAQANALERQEADAGAAGVSLAGAIRADALVDYGGRTWLRRRWIDTADGGSSSLPWRVISKEAPRVIAQ